MVAKLKVGDQFRQTNTRLRNIDDFEAYINNIDENYDSDDSIFNGYIYKLDTPQFNKVNRSLLWKSEGVSFKQAIQELKNNFKIVDNYITEENDNSHFEYIYKPKKIETHLTNFYHI